MRRTRPGKLAVSTEAAARATGTTSHTGGLVQPSPARVSTITVSCSEVVSSASRASHIAAAERA
eukprot:scaffold81991_cov72-Phaeocystis_antarctica.AAC.15